MKKYTVVEYRLGSGSTITAAIRLINTHALTPSMVMSLLRQYAEINGAGVPRMGDVVLIPTLPPPYTISDQFTTIVVER